MYVVTPYQMQCNKLLSNRTAYQCLKNTNDILATTQNTLETTKNYVATPCQHATTKQNTLALQKTRIRS